MWPQRIPELYRGEPLLVAARFEPGVAGRAITVSGQLRDKRWQRGISSAGAQGAGQAPFHPGVAATWARRKIESLLDGKVLGRPGSEVRADVLPLALEHQLLSPYTSFLAVESVVSRPDSESLQHSAVANASPAGQAAQPYAWPKTAAGLGGRLLLGCLLLLAWLFVSALRCSGDKLAVQP
jgi:Ca-activated chloride channel family protein